MTFYAKAAHSLVGTIVDVFSMGYLRAGARKFEFRRGVAEKLRDLADRIGPEDAFCATGIHFYFKFGVGKVIVDDEVLTAGRRQGPGVRCWYRRSDYDARRWETPEMAEWAKCLPWNQD